MLSDVCFEVFDGLSESSLTKEQAIERMRNGISWYCRPDSAVKYDPWLIDKLNSITECV